jgi:hypothetical protein
MLRFFTLQKLHPNSYRTRGISAAIVYLNMVETMYSVYYPLFADGVSIVLS